MSYTALYRKFRPGEFSEVKGQDHIITTLRNQVKMDRIGHAYLFCGTRGTGKTTVAKILAKAVNCENPVDGSPCEECEMCRKINAQTSMNVVEIDAASNNGVGNVRDIIEEMQYSPTEGRFKVYIIDEVHMLSTGAFNALLKTLEEPPAYVIFILATTEAHKIPITILSRCQRYDFKRISIDTIAARLREVADRETAQVEDKALHYIARTADGSMRDALSLLDRCLAFYLGQELTYDKALDVLGAVDTEVYSRMFRSVNAYDAVGCVEIVDEMMVAGRDLDQFVGEFIWYLRGLMLLDASDQGTDMLDVSTERMAQMQEEAAMTEVDVLIRYIHVLSDLSAQLRYATQKRVMVEVALIRLCRPQMETVVPTGNAAPKPDEAKIVPKAVPDEVRQIVGRWNEVIQNCDPVERTMLSEAKKTVSEEGTLILQFTDAVSEGYFLQDERKQLEALRTIIQNLTGLDVPLQTRTVDAQMDARYADLSELIQFDGVEYK